MTISSASAAPAFLNLTVMLKMQIEANGEDPDYIAQRLNSAVYQAIAQAGLTRACPDSQALVAHHQFSLQIDPTPSSAEAMLLQDGPIGAGDAMAFYEMPETVQEAFAAGWNKHRELAAAMAHEAPEDAAPSEQPL